MIKQFRKIIKEHQGNLDHNTAWWDAYDDLKECHIAFGRLLELTKINKKYIVFLVFNHITLEKIDELLPKNTP